MRLRTILAPAVLLASLASAPVAAWAEPNTFDQDAYLAQAAKAGSDETAVQNASLRGVPKGLYHPIKANRSAAIPEAATVGIVGGISDYLASHNGSEVMVSPATGTIHYFRPKASLAGIVPSGATLFRGSFGKGAISGTAYVFRRGCSPAPYAVTGIGYTGPGSGFVLIGHPPIRAPGSCSVIGYGDNSNSVLHFDPDQDGDI